jgi:predicted metal-binding membrane protein
MQPLYRLPSPWLARWALLLGSAGWGWTLYAGDAYALPALCSALPAALLGSSAGVAAWLSVTPLSGLLVGWLAMLAAMMPPLLVGPAADIWQRSLPQRRWRSIALFTCGYFILWIFAGTVLLALALAMLVLADGRAMPAFAAMLGLALLWQASPWRQLAFNRCHHEPRLSAFGRRADRDALRYGCTHALACIAACWALMLLPLLAGAAHVALMLPAGLLLALERALPAQPARWRLPWLDLLQRYWAARPARMRLA